LPAADLPSGGPAYPLPTPGIRLRAKPTNSLVTLLGLFNGSPASLRQGDPQILDPSGTNFDVSSGAFVIGETQYRVNREKDAIGLPATYKLGAWYNSNSFKDPFFTNGAIVPSEGPFAVQGGSRRGDSSVYGTLDQLVYRPAGSDDGGLGITARAMGAPGDRNVIDVFAQAGLTYKGAFDRPNDTMGIGVNGRTYRIAHARATGRRRNFLVVFIPCAAAKPWSRRPTRRRSSRGGSCNRIASTSWSRAAAFPNPTNPDIASATPRCSSCGAWSRFEWGSPAAGCTRPVTCSTKCQSPCSRP